MSGERGWDFPYVPLTGGGEPELLHDELIVATASAVPADEIARALGALDPHAQVASILARAPLFWLSVRTSKPVGAGDVCDSLVAAKVAVRYVAPMRVTSAAAPPALGIHVSMRARSTDWSVRRSPGGVIDPPSPTRWFLGSESGVAVDRRRCGTGAGTRIAVIDDDGADAHRIGFDREVPVNVEAIRRASTHGTLIAAWAVGTLGDGAFAGVAPAASPRLYAVPSAGTDVVSLPLAIARATFDGADVVVCATYVERSWSPMLDDALDVASRLGRRGRGTAVVMPSGREASSPPESIHASWSLALGDPASDPRVFCVGPSGRSGAWFLWRDRRSRLRPFANRGPAVRWLAPGDDLADPLQPGDRWCHAESSGAAAIAAGVLLLVIAANPSLRLREVSAIVTRTCTPVRPEDDRMDAAADRFDLLPFGVDADHHNAKHGYGRMNARAACTAARDPIAAELFAMGEEAAAVRAFDRLARVRPWSRRTARWVVRCLLADGELAHALRVILRHMRLLASAPERARAHAQGALSRQLVLIVRALRVRRAIPGPVAAQLGALEALSLSPACEPFLASLAERVWRKASGPREARRSAARAEAENAGEPSYPIARRGDSVVV